MREFLKSGNSVKVTIARKWVESNLDVVEPIQEHGVIVDVLVIGEDAETRRHGDAESPRVMRDAGHEATVVANVQGFEASSESKIQALGIGRGYNPCPIPVSASPHPRVPASLNDALISEPPPARAHIKVGDVCYYGGKDYSWVPVCKRYPLTVIAITGEMATVRAPNWYVTQEIPLADLRLIE
jgi:hypothetical protein